MQEYYLRLFEESSRTSLFVTSELEEAISRVKKIMEVDLPRPRTYQALASTRHLALKEEALQALHEEALRAFATGTTGAYDLVEAYRKRASGG